MNDLVVVHGRAGKMSKIDRYQWKAKDAPGELKILSKHLLRVCDQYQRPPLQNKVVRIASAWSWIAFGALVVGERAGEYFIIDGEHRHQAALKRSDVDLLPCVVFQTESVAQEAAGFLGANTERKPVSSHDKFRASVAADDEIAKKMESILRRHGISLSRHPSTARQMKSVSSLLKMTADDSNGLEIVLSVAAAISGEKPITEILLQGLFYIHKNANEGLTGRILKRVYAVGAARLVDGAKRAAAYYARGGAKVWADGMLTELNKNLQHKFELLSKDSP